MQITYHFLDEDVSIDVSPEWGSILIDLDRQEYNNNHKETRRHTTLDNRNEDGAWLACALDFDEPLIRQTNVEAVHAALRQLRPQQQKLLYALYLSPHPVTQAEYARRLGIQEESVKQSAWRARNALKKLLQKV